MAATLGTSSIARRRRLIQEIWEGTHPVLAAHVEKALRRRASSSAFLALLAPGPRRALEDRLRSDAALPDEAREAAHESLCDAAYAALTETNPT